MKSNKLYIFSREIRNYFKFLFIGAVDHNYLVRILTCSKAEIWSSCYILFIGQEEHKLYTCIFLACPIPEHKKSVVQIKILIWAGPKQNLLINNDK